MVAIRRHRLTASPLDAIPIPVLYFAVSLQTGRTAMLRRSLFYAVIGGVLPVGAARAQQQAVTPQEINRIEALVTKAALLVESRGKEAAFAEFGKRNSEWWHGSTYLFAYDMNGNVLLNPAAPSRVGTNPLAEKDANGKAFHRALIEMGRVNGSGWVDYLIARPGKPEPSPKWSYVKAVKFDGVPGVIGAGFYLD